MMVEIILCYYDHTQIKVDHLQFQTIPYSYLYDQTDWVFLVIFAVIKKIRDGPDWCGLWPQRVKFGIWWKTDIDRMNEWKSDR